jgi:hypothetical protein
VLILRVVVVACLAWRCMGTNCPPPIGYGVDAVLSTAGVTAVSMVGASGTNNTRPYQIVAGGNGAVTVYAKLDLALDLFGDWTMTASLAGNNTEASDGFGASVAQNLRGDYIYVGAPFEDSNATGLDGPDNNNAADSGAVYFFLRTSNTDFTSERCYQKPSDTTSGQLFGWSVSVDIGGLNVVVGSPGFNSSAGKVYLLRKSGPCFVESASFVGQQPGDQFGASVSISWDALTFLVGAPQESGGGGAVYRFRRATLSDAFTLADTFRPPSNGANAQFGSSVSINRDGSRFVVGAPGGEVLRGVRTCTIARRSSIRRRPFCHLSTFRNHLDPSRDSALPWPFRRTATTQLSIAWPLGLLLQTRATFGLR